MRHSRRCPTQFWSWTAPAVVCHVNPKAAALFPGLCRGTALSDNVPVWLATAHAQTANSRQADNAAVPGLVGERSFEAHPTVQDDGNVVWWLVDDTDHQLAREALREERERTAFLTEASNTLLSSLNLERCMDVIAQLAAEHLADAAVVIAPRSARRLPVVLCLRGGRPQRFRWDVDPSEVPGLAEALQGFPPVPSRWIDPASAPEWLVPEGFGTVGSIVVTPLPGHGVPAGALVLLRRSGETAFSDGEEVFARLFAARSGAAMSAARLYAEQVSLTQTLMRDLLPLPCTRSRVWTSRAVTAPPGITSASAATSTTSTPHPSKGKSPSRCWATCAAREWKPPF